MLMLKLIKECYIFISLNLLWILGYIEYNKIIIFYICQLFYARLFSKTRFSYKKTQRNEKIISNCPNLPNVQFVPHLLLPNSTMQTLAWKFLSSPPEDLNFKRQNVNEFGSSLDWITLKSEIKTKRLIENKDLIIILPGLTGSKDEKYVKNIAYEALKNNFEVVIYNNRLISKNLVLPQKGAVCLVEEFNSALKVIEETKKDYNLYAIGYSYGANKIINFLGTMNKNLDKNYHRIKGGISICNPYDLLIGQRFMEGSINDYIVNNILKKVLIENRETLELNKDKSNFDIIGGLNSQTTRDFDDNITRRMLGFKTVDEYYRKISSVNNIMKVDVPLLCIHALDDNIAEPKAIPFDEIKANENIFSLTTDLGGHIFYMDNSHFFKFHHWVNKPAIEFLVGLRKSELN